MTPKFQIEQTIVVKNKAYVLCKHLNNDIKFILTDHSYLGDIQIEKWMDVPKAVDEKGNYRKDFYSFVLKNLQDKEKIKVDDVIELWDDYIEVVESYKIADKIICFLKCYAGKLNAGLFLRDNQNKEWTVKQYLTVFGSIDTYEKIQKQEEQNIFQYLLEGNGHDDKPSKDIKLQVIKTAANKCIANRLA